LEKEDWRRRIGEKLREIWASGLVVGILGSGARESNFLELGSQRGSVPSWLGGNSFRQAVSGTFRQAVSAGQPSSSRGNSAIIIFVLNSSNSSYNIYRYTM
jgi:hypothetical protein